MSGKNWTQQKWLLTDSGETVYALGENGTNVFSAQLQHSGREKCSKEELFANANLIAAAPNLYEALENLLGVVYGVGGTKPNAQQLAKKALAKARGEK